MSHARSLLPCLLVLSAATLSACSQAPTERLLWRESWEIAGIADDGTLLDASALVSNLGLLRGQGHLGVSLFPLREAPISLRRHGAPSAVTLAPRGDALHILGNRLEQDNGGWLMEVREGRDALDATFRLAGTPDPLPPVPMVTGERQWIVGCEMHRAQLSGAWRAGQRGDMVRGQAILIRRAGDVLPARETERLSAYVLHPSFSLGLERYGAFSFGWFSDASGPKQSSTVRIEEVEGGLRFDLNPEIPVKGRILLQREPLVLYPWDHLLAFEAQVVRKVWGTPVRSLSHATARVEIEGAEVESRAMIVRVRWQDILPPRPEKVLPAPAGLPADPRATNPTERFRPPGSVAPSKP